MRLFPLSLSSADRDHDLYPNANHYVARFPFRVSNVMGVQLASLEMPSANAQMTIEADLNDRFTFSEGLRIDLGEQSHTVESTTMFNNQLMIKESSNKYVVSVPSYLAKITGFSGNVITTSDTNASGASSWYSCYVAWRSTRSQPMPPKLLVIGGMAGYVEAVTTAGTLTNTSANSSFTNAFVHLQALSIEEICAYLTYAFANYSTYAATPSTAMANRYTFEYYLGKIRIRVDGTSANVSTTSLHFPMATNAPQTAFYGSQNNGFSTRLQLNSNGGRVTSLGYMLGLPNNALVTTKKYIYQSQIRESQGFHAYVAPKCLFEARLHPGIYTQSSLALHLPIAMNPLHFVSSLNTATTGACYFGFLDSAKNEKLVIINEGKYTIETFCQALEHAFNRLDENAPYFSKDRFAYRGAALNHHTSTAWPDLTLDNHVVYNVTYDFATSKFTIESAWVSSMKPFDPSTATTLNASKPPPAFGLLFDPTSLARIATQVDNLSSLCTNANVDRVANVLGFRIQDYQGQSTYTSDVPSYIPRIDFPLSQNFELFKQENADDLGIGRASSTTSAGTPPYLYPCGRYRVVGFVPTRQNLNLSSGATYAHESQATYFSTGNSGAPSVAITSHGFRTTDYALSPPSAGGSKLTTNMYLVIDNTTAGDPESAAIVQIDSVNQGATSDMATGSVIDVGTGSASGATRSFVPIGAHDNVRLLSVTNVSGSARCALLSTHTNGLGTNGEALATTMPFGLQVGDVAKVKCWSEALITNTTASVTVTTGTTLGPLQGLEVGATYGVAAGTAVLGEFHIVNGGARNGIVKVTTAGGAGVGEVEVVEAGTRYFPSTTYALSQPILPYEIEVIAVQHANSGAHFQDSDNSQKEQFMACVPHLDLSYGCLAGKLVDGACMRFRIPPGLDQLVATFPRCGHVQRLAEFLPARVAIHIEEENSMRIKAQHAQDVLGIGRTNLPMDYTLTFPNAMNTDPVHYVMVKFANLNNKRSQQVHFSQNKVIRDVVGKVVLGAPVAISRSLVSRIEFAPQTLDQLEIVFYMPDGETKYNFNGRDHTLTLNLMIMERKRKVGEI